MESNFNQSDSVPQCVTGGGEGVLRFVRDRDERSWENMVQHRFGSTPERLNAEPLRRPRDEFFKESGSFRLAGVYLRSVRSACNL